jgi:hypothetical protein
MGVGGEGTMIRRDQKRNNIGEKREEESAKGGQCGNVEGQGKVEQDEYRRGIK